MLKTIIENLTKRIEYIEGFTKAYECAQRNDRELLEELYQRYLRLHALVDKLHFVDDILVEEKPKPKKSHVIDKLKKSRKC